MDRVLKGSTATVAATFRVDGVATDPPSNVATVEIVRRDGTVLVAEAAATRISVGTYGRTLTPADMPGFDRLAARWVADLGGGAQTLVTFVEVIGPEELQVRDLVAKMTDSITEPVLSDDDLADLVALGRVPDPAGVDPLFPAWVERLDPNFSAAEGWRWKAGRVATSFSSTSLSGEQEADSFKYLNCIRLAEHYAARAFLTRRLG